MGTMKPAKGVGNLQQGELHAFLELIQALSSAVRAHP
jgi:hypothetical protein